MKPASSSGERDSAADEGVLLSRMSAATIS
jgi:hypothetical protein